MPTWSKSRSTPKTCRKTRSSSTMRNYRTALANPSAKRPSFTSLRPVRSRLSRRQRRAREEVAALFASVAVGPRDQWRATAAAPCRSVSVTRRPLVPDPARRWHRTREADPAGVFDQRRSSAANVPGPVQGRSVALRCSQRSIWR